MAVAFRPTHDTPSGRGPRATASPIPSHLRNLFGQVRDESGQDFAEYGFVLALVVTVAAASFTQLGGTLETVLSSVVTALISLLS